MEEPTVLRTTKIGGGFVKEDVMTYLDELNSKIVGLEEELQAAKSGPANDAQEIQRYKTQIENLQEKLNTSNNALRAAKKENEDLQKTVAQLKAGAQNGAQNAAANQALEAAKKEIDTLKAQLKNAGGQQNNAALDAAKKEIETLRTQLKTAEQKAVAAPAANAASDAELSKAKQELARITSELAMKSKDIDNKNHEISDKDNKIKDLTKAKEEADEKIKKLNDEIADLKENGAGMIPASFDMGALFTEAQKTANKVTIEAQKNADRVTREANEKAEKVTKEANENAEKIVADAKIEAERTIANATTAAETALREANDQSKKAIDKANSDAKALIEDANSKAKSTVDTANAHADKVNEMTDTVREMILNEISSVNTKFDDITSVLKRLSTQAIDRMDEAQLIIGEARTTLDSKDNDKIKKIEAPSAKFEAITASEINVKEVVAAAANGDKKDDKSGKELFGSADKSFGANKPNNGFNSNNNNNINKPSSAPANNQNKPQQNNGQPQKKSSIFNNDMAELLKAVEEEASKSVED